MKQRILALLLALAMAVSLAACGDGAADSTQSGSGSGLAAEPEAVSAEEAYEQAKACYDELTALSEEEQYDAFLDKQAELNYDGNTEEFYVTPDISLVDGFSDTVLALDEYEIGLSGQTDYGYFVVMRLPISEEDMADIKDAYVNDLFMARLSEGVDAAEVVEADVLSQVDFHAYFEKLGDLQVTIDTKYTELTASGEDEDTSSTPSEEEIEEALLAIIPQEALEDCASYLTDGVLTNDTVVLTVDGEEVIAATYLYFLGYYETYFMSMSSMYGQDISLDDQFSEDETYLEAFQGLAKTYCVQYATAKNMAVANNAIPTEEDLGEIQTILEQSLESDVLYTGSNVAALEGMLTYGIYGDTYQDYLYGENGVEAVTDEAVQEYAGENGYYNCRYILFHVDETTDETTDETSEDTTGDASGSGDVSAEE